ncbi:MAG: hypothetical protein IKX89_02365 [Firmicutes bacterium]|nr:hypothetical protein [Bacillota bacterium]
MNRIKNAYDSIAPGAGELAAQRDTFLQELDVPQTGIRSVRKRISRRWRVAAVIASCLIIGTAAVGATTGKLRTWVIDSNRLMIKSLDIDLPDSLGDYELNEYQHYDRLPEGEEHVSGLSKPLYRSYGVYYSKPNNIDYVGFDGSHGTEYRSDRIHLTFGFTEGLEDEDWMTYFHYDPETKKWIPYENTVFPGSDLTRTTENLEEISYRGATIWIYELTWHQKEGKPEYYYDAGANWYDSEIGAWFQADFSTPTYDVIVDKAYDKNGNLIHDSVEEVIRPENVLSKETLLEYIKEIIDLNR